MVLRKYDKDLDDSQPLWRYMSFDQFVHILATRTLWLAPLSSMEDKREGEWIDVQISPPDASIQESFEYAAVQTVISSWVAVDEESLPLWNSHAPSDTGVAISTTVHSLIRALAGHSIRNDFFYLVRVEYCDQPQTIHVKRSKSYDPVLCAKYKSSDFRYENEVRIVYSRSGLLAVTTPGVPIPAEPGKGTHILIKKIADHPISQDEIWLLRPVAPGKGTHTCKPILPDGIVGVIDYSSVPPATGTYIRVTSIPALMINGVYVSPRANRWAVETVKSLMTTYGHDSSLVQNSALSYLFETATPPPFEHKITYE